MQIIIDFIEGEVVKKLNCLYILLFFVFGVTVAVFPKICIVAVRDTLILCGNVLIPSLFPITVCTIIISKLLDNCSFGRLDKITFNIFGLSGDEFILFLLSALGGYPMGAKLLNDKCSGNENFKIRATIMQNYFVNGGIGFIVIAIGEGIFGLKQIGYILYLSHILSSLVLCFLFSFKLKKEKIIKSQNVKMGENIIDVFVYSVSDGANILVLICGFTLFFSAVTTVLNTVKHTKLLCMLLEITNGVTLTKNIYLVAFLLGFSGVSVIFQIISIGKGYKINVFYLLLSRIAHGLLSVLFVFVFLKIFKVNIPTISNGVNFTANLVSSKIQVGISVLILSILFIISLEGKNKGGNLRKDLLK